MSKSSFSDIKRKEKITNVIIPGSFCSADYCRLRAGCVTIIAARVAALQVEAAKQRDENDNAARELQRMADERAAAKKKVAECEHRLFLVEWLPIFFNVILTILWEVRWFFVSALSTLVAYVSQRLP